MKIAAETVVELSYTLHLGDGEIVDSSTGDEPFLYLHGAGQIVPGLERALEGLEAGAAKVVVVAPADGYGEHDDERIEELPMDAFEEEVKEGDEFIATDEEGDEVPVRIIAVENGMVTADFNHPLAGETLHFSVTVKTVRAATADELEHGHAHGADGHGHGHDDGTVH